MMSQLISIMLLPCRAGLSGDRFRIPAVKIECLAGSCLAGHNPNTPLVFDLFIQSSVTPF
jgi:hypothetical protein